MDYDADLRPLGGGFDIGADEDAPGVCSANADNPGATCSADDDCPPNSGNPANQGTCELPL
jgi:hypothetical protein